MATSKTLTYIDLFKGVAILGVVAVHYRQNFGAPNEILSKLFLMGGGNAAIILCNQCILNMEISF